MSSAELTFANWLNLQFAQTPDVFARNIASAAGISPGYISGLRKSRKENPSPEVAEKIADAFANARGLSPDERKSLLAAARLAAATSVAWHRAQEDGREAAARDRGRWPALISSFNGRRK